MADFSYQLFIIGTLFGIIEKEKKKEKNDFFFLLGKKKNGEEKMWISLLFISFNNYEENGEK